jgi:uncharacterized protein YcbK (DUF882 family)
VSRRIALVLPACVLAAGLLAFSPAVTPADTRDDDTAAPAGPLAAARLGAAALGRSGSLRSGLALPGARVEIPLEWEGASGGPVPYRWLPVLGTTVTLGDASLEGHLSPDGAGFSARAPGSPGVYALSVGDGAAAALVDGWRLIVKVPGERVRGGRLNGYFIGEYPRDARPAFRPPAGFIEVTPANRDLYVSRHFRIGEFVTKDQVDRWPKYVVIDPRLIDKLELVMQELQAMGVRADRMVVMSGYRTPQYNLQGVGRGRASLSRHQYGDAADVWVDNEGDWHMSDLNGDGRRDAGDARVMLRAVERVEAKHPELAGGAGIYPANRVRGPFIHIDVRGQKERW